MTREGEKLDTRAFLILTISHPPFQTSNSRIAIAVRAMQYYRFIRYWFAVFVSHRGDLY